MTNCIFFWSNEDIISTHQSGFRSLHSTVTTLLEATDNWAFNIDRGNVNAVVFLDLKKTFALLIMTSFYLKWTFTEYKELLRSIGLDRIWQIVHNDAGLVNGSISRICSLKCWVPQGTILGPLLFLIYINDLPNCLTSCQPRMYADDTHITYADVDVNSIQLNLNHDLGNLNKSLIQQTYFDHY